MPELSEQALFDLDDEFNACHVIVSRNICLAEALTEDVENAADRMFDIAIALSDKTMLAACFVCFEDYVRYGLTPPRALLEQLAAATMRWRGDKDMTLDQAFGAAKNGRGRPSTWRQREDLRRQAETIAILSNFVSPTQATAQAGWFYKKTNLKKAAALAQNMVVKKVR